METTSSPRHYSDLERQELIEQWKQSGKNKAAFCKEREISYYSFNDWVKRGKKPASPAGRKAGRPKSSFVPVLIKNSTDSIFAQISLKNSITVNIYQVVDANYLSTLLKA